VKQNKQLIQLFLMGILAFFLLNFPLLSLSSKAKLVLGFPQLYVYIFSVWLLLIFAVFLILRKKGEPNE
jgi:hypothetical protein